MSMLKKIFAGIFSKKKSKQISNSSNNEHTVSTSGHIGVSQTSPVNARIVQNFLLVWLDENIDEVNNKNCCNTIIQLRQIVYTINTFTDVDKCKEFISGIKGEKIFMISSGTLGQRIVPIVHIMPQVSAIYIFCKKKACHKQWTKSWPKIRGVFTDIQPICKALRQAAQDCDRNTISMGFVPKNHEIANKDLNQLDQSYMYTEILKEILLTIDFKQEQFDEFLTYCREKLVGSAVELKHVDKLEKEYRSHTPTWWYTYDCFLYSMLNRALRTMEVDLIIKMGFFIRDLHQDIVQIHLEQYANLDHFEPFTVYRGQGIAKTDFGQLVETKGGLLSFNNFLSTSKNRHVSLDFARRAMADPELVGILFVMKIDSVVSTTHFTNISYFQNKEEILFSMHSIFRVGQIKQIGDDNRLWQVELTLASDNDRQVHALTERLREETKECTGWLRLGKLMIKVARFSDAEALYELLLHQTTDDDEKGNIYYQLGYISGYQGNYAQAITFYENSLKIRQETLSLQHPDVAECYNNLGSVYDNMGEYSKALSYHEKALEIYQNTLPKNHPHLATSNVSHGNVYEKMGQYTNALSSYQKALEIRQIALPANHPDLATTYSNIGSIYDRMGEYSEARSFHEKTLTIYKKTLPTDHPDLALCYNQMGLVCEKMGEYSEALLFHDKALEIYKKTLPANRAHMATSYSCRASIYDKKGEYSKALCSHQKALEILERFLPENHSDVAVCYSSIGLICEKLGEYLKALSAHEKAFKIRKTSLSADQSGLALSYNNIGLVYDKMGEYSKALSSHEAAFEILKTIFPENHLQLALPYNNIGLVYEKIGDYWKALFFHEKACKILKTNFPNDHPYVARSYNNIGLVYEKMDEYLKALLFYKKALKIRKNSLPKNLLDLASSYANHGTVYEKMGEYAKALSFQAKSLKIRQKILSVNHPDLAFCYNNIGLVLNKMNDYSKALSFLEKAVDIYQETVSEHHPDLALCYNKIGLVYSNKGDYSRALSLFESAIEIAKCSLPSSHSDLLLYKNNAEMERKKL